MRLYNHYLVTLTLLFTITTVLFAAYGQQKLDLYFSVYLLEYLAATLVFAYLHPRARRLLNSTGYVFFGGFLAILALKVVQILVGVEISSAGLSGTAMAQDLPPHKDPMAEQSQFDGASYLGGFGGVVSRLVDGDYEDVPGLVDQLRKANIPEDLRLIIDRSIELLGSLRDELDSTDSSLRKVSVFLELGDPSAARRELEYADSSILEARRMFEDLQVGVDTMARRLGVFGAAAGTPLRVAYDRLQPLFLRLNELSDQYAALYEQLEAGVDVPVYGDTPIYQTELQFDTPSTLYPERPIHISGRVTTVDGPDPGTVSLRVLLDEHVIASLVTSTVFEQDFDVPENVLLGKHLLSVELPTQGLYEGTLAATTIEVVQASPNLEVRLPRLMFFPTDLNVSGEVTSPLGPARDAFVDLQVGDTRTTVHTDGRGRFAGSLPLSLDQLYLGPQSLLVAVQPTEPWHGPVFEQSSLYIINIANLSIVSLGVLYVAFMYTMHWHRRRMGRSSGASDERTFIMPGAPGLAAAGVPTPTPTWAHVDPGTSRGRIVSAYHRAAHFLASSRQAPLKPALTLRDFQTAISPQANAAFFDLTDATERALYAADSTGEEDARQAERLEKVVRENEA